MSEQFEIHTPSELDELLQGIKRMQYEQAMAEATLLGVFRRYQIHQEPICLTGYPSRVVVPHHDEDGIVTSRKAVNVGPIAPRQEGHVRHPRTIEQGAIVDVKKELQGPIISVEPIGTDTWWQFGLNSIVKIEPIKQDEIGGRIKTQRAIINSETFWVVGIGNQNNGPKRHEPYYELR